MELKEGMYIRTKDGLIDKVIIDYKGCCNSPNCNCKHVSCEHNYYDEENIIKASYNLIDLIEVGDYVNGKEVTEVMRDEEGNVTDIVYTEEVEGQSYSLLPIKDIVTREYFNSGKYKEEQWIE